MDAGKSSPLSSFKSKKQLHSPAPSDEKSRKVSESDPTPWSVKTPGKPADPPRRSRRRAAAMSIKEVKEAALRLRVQVPDPPARSDPLMVTEKELIAKPKKKSVDSEMMFPEKYELLDKFFNSLCSSIMLLQLKRSPTTFTNISPQIEILTERRFTYSHVAQLRFIMPEAIVVERVLRHDERTSCMEPDLRITLDVEAIESKSKPKSHSRNLQLRKVFRGRLRDFFKSHPEGDDVPEAALPDPFGQLKENACANSAHTSSSSSTNETTNVASFQVQPITASHLPLSFKRHFSLRDSAHTSVDLEDKLPEKETNAIAANSNSKLPLKPSGGEIIPSSPLPETPVKSINSIEDEDQCSVTPLLKTPVDAASTPARLMSFTPSLNPPKRCYMSPDDNSSRTPIKLVRRPPPNRPLKFDTPVKSRKTDNDGILDILPEALLESIREKERLASIERDPAISQAKWRKQMIAGLPKLFDMIYFLFQSIRRSVVTKEELIQKIITGHLDVVDRREVEEQLRLLQEFAPEWIHEKSASSGDLLFCVNRISSPDAIRSKLSEAK